MKAAVDGLGGSLDGVTQRAQTAAQQSEEFGRRVLESLQTFNETTIEMQAEQAAFPWWQQKWYRNLHRGCVVGCWLLGLVLSGMLGDYAANRMVPRENTQLIRELPVIEKLDAYSDVDGMEFLKELDKQRVFDEDESDIEN